MERWEDGQIKIEEWRDHDNAGGKRKGGDRDDEERE